MVINSMNKKGWIRIVEATMAIMIIMGFVLTYTAKQERVAEDLTNIITPILEEMAEDNGIRESVLNYDVNLPVTDYTNKITINNLKSFVKERVTDPGLNYTIRICEIYKICGLEGYPSDAKGDVFAVERVISVSAASTGEFNPKKVKIFMWRIS